jgi:glyoxylase-like metal-dependent hydrolase (beta-lactamase superfamily II)
MPTIHSELAGYTTEVVSAEMMTTSFKVLSDGIVKFDGGSMFGQVPKMCWEEKVPTDRRNRITLGLNSLVVQIGGKVALVDAGVGAKELDDEKETYGLVPSRLLKGLKSLGLAPKDVDVVILTHLHFDHSGGCTKLDRAGNLVPTFPKAKYYVQNLCWQDACTPNERHQEVHRDEDFRPIEERGQLELLDGDEEILPGVWVKVTNGHARGHQIVMVNHGGERIAFLGDLVPTRYHLDPAAISAFDQFPEETLQRKKDILGQAERDGWLLIFSHGYDQKAGYLERRNGGTYLRPVDL